MRKNGTGPRRGRTNTASRAAALLPILALLTLGGGAAAMEEPFASAEPAFDQAAALECLALNIYHEARGEPEQGKLAVGHVVLNRSVDGGFPRDVCEVVRQGGDKRLNRCQFSWWCDGLPDAPREPQAWQEALRVARAVVAGETADPTGGALWYHADYVLPSWFNAFERGPVIGRHVFYRRLATSGHALAAGAPAPQLADAARRLSTVAAASKSHGPALRRAPAADTLPSSEMLSESVAR